MKGIEDSEFREMNRGCGKSELLLRGMCESARRAVTGGCIWREEMGEAVVV